MSNTVNAANNTHQNKHWLIFTDLDGTLLDHYNYSFAPAVPILAAINAQQIPLIIATSKTAQEVFPLRQQLHNRFPFIVENGAGIYLPLACLNESHIKQIPGLSLHQGYWRLAISPARQHFQDSLNRVGADFKGLFASFHQLGSQGIAQATGLSLQDTTLANQREFSEPRLWLGDQTRKADFIQQLESAGARVLQGGRFLHLTGNTDKGKALTWLTQHHNQAQQRTHTTLAAGDGKNDIAMLECADYALVMQSPLNPTLNLSRTQNLFQSAGPGPGA